jgi:hypothetical protein
MSEVKNVQVIEHGVLTVYRDVIVEVQDDATEEQILEAAREKMVDKDIPFEANPETQFQGLQDCHLVDVLDVEIIERDQWDDHDEDAMGVPRGTTGVPEKACWQDEGF